MSAAAEARVTGLDRLLDAQTLEPGLATELFAVADLLSGQAALRNAIADVTVSDDRRAEFARSVFASRVGEASMVVVAAAAAMRWGTPSGLVAAIDREGVRALLGSALASGTLDGVEDELFRFARTVAGNDALRQVLDNRSVPAIPRQQVVSDLLSGKADPNTVELARRAVAMSTVSFDATIQDYLALAAAVRQRAVAVVTVARPLAGDQTNRLRAAIERQIGRQIALHVIVDSDVLGGVRVQVGDEVIEGTVAGKLAAAEKQLTK